MRVSLPMVCLFHSWTVSAAKINTIITDSDAHTTLETALTQAGLLDTLGGDGPYTVIAPTDAAFEASLTDLGAANLAAVLARDDLAEILEYHVHPMGKVDPLVAGEIDTMQMMKATVTVTGDVTKVVGATEATISSKVDADNGVAHVCTDKILLPKPIATVATENGSFGVLLEALTKASLADTFGLKNDGKLYTVFAPTDAAFTAYLTDKNITKQQLLDDATLGDILKYHVVSGKTMASGITAAAEVDTLFTGNKLTLDKAATGGVTVNGYAVATVDVLAGNGVIHVVDTVLAPGVSAPTTTVAPTTAAAAEANGCAAATMAAAAAALVVRLA